MYIRHSFYNLLHKEFADRMTRSEILVLEQTAKIMVHVREDHEYLVSTGFLSFLCDAVSVVR